MSNYTKITISGKICTGKTTLFERLEKKLKWKAFKTGQLFRDYVTEHNLNLNEAEEQNNKLTKKIDNYVKEMLHRTGNLIVDGWLSGISATGLDNVLKILLICKDEIRYKRFAKREKTTLKEATKKVEERQRSWFKKIEKIHGIKDKALLDPGIYDLIIDTSYITPQSIVRRVLEELKK